MSVFVRTPNQKHTSELVLKLGGWNTGRNGKTLDIQHNAWRKWLPKYQIHSNDSGNRRELEWPTPWPILLYSVLTNLISHTQMEAQE